MAAAVAFLLAHMVIVFIVLAIVFLFVIVPAYLIPAIALYNIAKNAGHPYPWLAFIPLAQTFLEYTLPKRRYKVFFIDTADRKMMGILVLCLANFGSGIIAGLNVIPAIGQILDIALAVFLAAFNWRKMYDMLRTVSMDHENALIVSIISLFIPWVYAIVLLCNMKKEPEFGFGNWATTEIEGKGLATATEKAEAPSSNEE